jgi:hypothetical protein
MSDSSLAVNNSEMIEHLCFSCGFPLPAEEKFCGRCQMPIGALMSSDPLQSAHQEGLLYARAVDAKQPKLIIVVCMWMLLFPIAAFAGVVAVLILINFTQAGFFGALTFLGALAVTYYILKMLIKMTANYLRKDEPAADLQT